MDGYIQEMLV